MSLAVPESSDPFRPAGEEPPSLIPDHWIEDSTAKLESIAGMARHLTARPVLKVAAWLVYGLVLAFCVLSAVVLLLVALVRMLDAYAPGPLWAGYLVTGLVFIAGGLVCWRLRRSPATDVS